MFAAFCALLVCIAIPKITNARSDFHQARPRHPVQRLTRHTRPGAALGNFIRQFGAFVNCRATALLAQSLGLKQPLAALAEQLANLTNDVWVADAHSVFYSLDGGVTWTKLSVPGSIWGSHPTSQWPEVYGATAADQNIAGCLYSKANFCE